jgi:predicted nucleic acid-binding Zn ribbon protein
MSRDTSQISRDRRLWLSEPCPSCAARAGLRCRTSHYRGKPTGWLHVARGWRQRSCPTCKARPGEPCTTPRGRSASRPHTARLGSAHRELLTNEQLWEELEQWGASMALVRFFGGGGNPGSIQAVTLEHENGTELTRWSHGEGELPEALAAPIWGRYALFGGHPRITGLLMWDARARSIQIAGKRGGRKFEEILSAPRQIARVTIVPPAANPLCDTSRDTSPPDTVTPDGTAAVSRASRSCERCGNPLAAGLRTEARYCSKRCRQAASRERLRQRSGRAGLQAPKRCARCQGPMPSGVRPEARYCSKRCRQAASRERLALARQPGAKRARRPRRAANATSSILRA